VYPVVKGRGKQVGGRPSEAGGLRRVLQHATLVSCVRLDALAANGSLRCETVLLSAAVVFCEQLGASARSGVL